MRLHNSKTDSSQIEGVQVLKLAKVALPEKPAQGANASGKKLFQSSRATNPSECTH